MSDTFEKIFQGGVTCLQKIAVQPSSDSSNKFGKLQTSCAAIWMQGNISTVEPCSGIRPKRRNHMNWKAKFVKGWGRLGLKFDEKLDISDMINCADNFHKTMAKALSIESDTRNASEEDIEEAEFFYRFSRAAAVKVYEITVENSWKMMQRWVKLNADNKIHEKPKRELFRTAHQSGLITDPVVWWEFFEGRNKTSHIYHEEIAEEVYALAKKLDEHLREFIERLKERI